MRTSAGQALMLGTSALQGFYRSAHSVCRIGLLGRHIRFVTGGHPLA